MGALIAAVIVPMMLLNFLGGIVGIVWLAILGKWSLVGLAVGWSVASPLVLSLAMLPGIGLATVPKVGELLGIVWIASLMLATSAVVFSIAGFSYSETFEGSPVPYVLAAYGTAMGPWSFMAKGSEHAAIPLGMLAFASVGMGAELLITGEYDLQPLLTWGAIGAAAGLVLMFGIGATSSREPY